MVMLFDCERADIEVDCGPYVAQSCVGSSATSSVSGNVELAEGWGIEKG